MNLEQTRFNMIEQQIRTWEVLDATVLNLMNVVKREDFVPDAHKALAFVDMEIPLARGGEHAVARGQCMLAPKVEARLLQDLKIKKNELVLEIGTGSGHMAALLAHSAANVVTLEIDSELVSLARANLLRAGISNVQVRHADGAKDMIEGGPFDVIVLSGSVAQVPPALLALLKPGGRLAAIVGDEPMMRATFVTHSVSGNTSAQPWDTLTARLLHFPEVSRFSF
jgi:protein-L-isoaspartate(D-aspartate) O-methyltransferase